jgi:beta-lactamase regulating signal transducer with metallopeptidase domain/protocatechuate 3,4-dioxygenase beta subunit
MTGQAIMTGSLATLDFLLTWLIQSTVLLALGLAAGRALRRWGPAVQSALYRTTLAAVLLCPVASLAMAALGFDGLLIRLPGTTGDDPAGALITDQGRERLRPGGGPEDDAIPVLPEPASIPMSPADLARTEDPGGPADGRPRTIGAPSPVGITTAPAVSAGSPTLADILGRVGSIVLAAWLLGSMVLALRLVAGHRRMRRLRSGAIPAEPEAEALCRELARHVRLSAPAVLRSPFLSSPCLDGLRRPAILLPEDAGADLRETFVHELAHLARRDGLWNLLRRLATAALWPQPLLWALSRRIEEAAEEVCDDVVVAFGADRARYAGLLLELARRRLPPLAPAGVGMIALRSLLARRVARILDSTRVLSTRAGARTIAATLLAGLAGTLLAGMLGVAGGPPRAEAQTPSKAAEALARPQAAQAEARPERKTIAGQVVGPDGKPFPGATVIAARVRRILNGIGSDSLPARQYQVVRTTAGADGRFELGFPTPHRDPEDPRIGQDAQVLATAPGFGLGYYLAGRPIRLTPGDLPINGRLIDLEGRPVAGVKVGLGEIGVPAPGSDRESLSREKPGSMAGRLILDAEPLLPDGVVTGPDGRFRIAGLGRDVLARLTISGPTVTFKKVQVLTRSMKRVPDEPPDAMFVGLDEPATHGAECTIAVEPTRPIEGVLRDAETGEPIPGAVVTAAALSGSELVVDGLIATETDAQGRYRLVGLPKEGGKGHKLAVYPPLDRPYFMTRRIEAPAAPGLEPLKFDIALRRGLWITGKVIDVATGKPVAAAVDYFPFLSNPHAKDYPNFDPNVTASVGIKTRYKTDREGRFRIVGLPGGGVVTAHTEDRSYRAGVGAESIRGRTGPGNEQLLTYDRIFPALYQGLKEVNISEGADSFTCDLGLDPGGSLLLRLVDTAGAPVTNATIWGRYPDGADHGDHNLYGESAARIGGLVKGQSRTVLIQHRDREIGAVLSVSADRVKKDPELTATLRPTATLTGRLVDAQGRPAKGGVRVELSLRSASLFRHLPVDRAELDAEGRFRCDLVPAGGPYEVTAANRLNYGMRQRMEEEAFKQFALAKDLKVEPGQAVDLGTVDVNSGRRVEERRAAKAPPVDVPITGRIVDLEGRPIAGVVVRVRMMSKAKGGDLTPWLEAVGRGEPPWIASKHLESDETTLAKDRSETTTDAQGRFRFEGLGAEKVIHLAVHGPTIADTSLSVVTRRLDPIQARGFPSSYGAGASTIHAADFTFTATPGRPIEGVVRDAGTNRPLTGVEVRSYRFAGSNFIGTMNLKTATDAQGHFRLVGFPKGRGNQLLVVPNDDQPYFMQEVEVPDPPGLAPVAVEIALHKGLWIEGKVVDKGTGKPVPKAWLHYLPFLENRFAQATPEFDKDGNTDGVGYQDRYQTKADGTFRLVGLPGRAIVGVIDHSEQPYLQGAGASAIKGMDRRGHFQTWRNPVDPGRFWPTSMKEINPPEGTEALRVDFALERGASVRIRLVDREGRPVAGAQAAGRTGRGAYDRGPQAEAEFDVLNLAPDEDRMLMVRHEGRRLGKVVHVHPGDGKTGPVVVTLEPAATISGRVLDPDGNPVSGATIRSDPQPSGDFSLHLWPQIASGKDGRFVVADVPTGCKYSLAVESRAATRMSRFTFFQDATVRPGESTDVGEIRFRRD